jgi:hypothetical protein
VSNDSSVEVKRNPNTDLPYIMINGKTVLEFVRGSESSRGLNVVSMLIHDGAIDNNIMDCVIKPRLWAVGKGEGDNEILIEQRL